MLKLRETIRKLKRTDSKPETPQNPASQPQPPVRERTKPYGLFCLGKNELPDDAKGALGIDIVAIHGLNGDAYTTWQHENGVIWLRDLLPSSLPGCRVFTYGYPSELFWSNSVAKLSDYSRNLLSCLKNISEEKTRPIIFVCHSLGGIVCKQALVLAHEDDRLYGDILSAVTAIVFFGTPHRGSKGADIGKVVARAINMCLRASQTARITGSIRDDLLTNLGINSQTLTDIAISSRNRLMNKDVVSFYETQTVPGLSDLVVDQSSAIMEIPGEDVISLFADHRNMCRFASEEDDGYSCTLRVIRRLVKMALSRRDMEMKVDRASSHQSLSEAEKSCMTLLNSIYLAEYKAQLPRPVRGTCDWIMSHPAYLTWLAAEQTRLLWVTGEPGCGKTMLSAYLADHLRLDRVAPARTQVFFFFCDEKVKLQRDANAILRGILYQILQQHRKLVKHVKHRVDLDGASLATSFSALWELFLKVVADSTSDTIGIIVDAIDECELKTRTSLLNAVLQLVNEPQDMYRQSRVRIKFLITSRPSLGNLHNMLGPEHRLPIEADQSIVAEDIKLVIRSKVGEIATRLRFNDETRCYLEQILYSKSNQSFLWLNLVLHSLGSSLKASKKDFERIINTFPDTLGDTYRRFLCEISSRDRADATKLLQLLIGCSRHLTLTEANIAFTIDRDHKSLSDMADNLQLYMRSTLQNMVGSFVRIKGSDQSSDDDAKVSLIHQSVKEYLTDLAFHSTDRSVRSFAIPISGAALELSQSCMRYLLLQEFHLDLFTRERASLEDDSPDSVTSLPFAQVEPEDPEGFLGLDDHLGLDNFFEDFQDIAEDQCVLISQVYKFFDYSAVHWAEHYSLCEHVAPKYLQETARQLLASRSFATANWLRYYWIRQNMEYSFPENFGAIELAGFFNLSVLLDEILKESDSENGSQITQALFWAARMSSIDSIKVLLQHSPDPNDIGFDRQTPLTVSAQHGHLDAVRILLMEPRTNIALRAKSDRSALSFAAGNGHLEVVQILLEHGAFTVDDQDNAGWTPLFWAVQGDYADIMRLLLKQSAIDVNQVDRSGRSVLSWAAGEGSEKALKVLIRHPSINLNLRDSKGRSPLSWAAGNGRSEAVSTFMHRMGIDKGTKDNDLRNAVSWACQGGHTDTLRILLKNRCGGEDEVDVDTWTPLLWALFNHSPMTVEVLLSTRKVQIDRQDNYGRTALTWAASYGYLEVVQLLVLWNANVHIRNHGGRTAAEIAWTEGHIEVYEFLKNQEV
ncbi:hypothetical protein ACN47E_001496 [Coniothyrium glycines]